MTREELSEVKAVVRRAIEEEREMYNEVWLSEKELLQQFGMFTHDWLKHYGHTLKPSRAIVIDENGVEHRSGLAYPRNRIQRMIANGEIMKLKCRVVRMNQVIAKKVAGV
jgi:hypothetical protein